MGKKGTRITRKRQKLKKKTKEKEKRKEEEKKNILVTENDKNERERERERERENDKIYVNIAHGLFNLHEQKVLFSILSSFLPDLVRKHFGVHRKKTLKSH